MIDYEAAIEAASSLTKAFDEFKARNDARLDRLETRQNRPPFGGMDRSAGGEFETRAFAKWLRHGSDRLTAEEAKSLQVVPSPSGGYLAPDQFVRELLRNV